MKKILADQAAPLDQIQEKHDALISSSQEFAQRIYAAAQAQGMGDQAQPSSGPGFTPPNSSDDVAEAEVVEDEMSDATKTQDSDETKASDSIDEDESSKVSD